MGGTDPNVPHQRVFDHLRHLIRHSRPHRARTRALHRHGAEMLADAPYTCDQTRQTEVGADEPQQHRRQTIGQNEATRRCLDH